MWLHSHFKPNGILIIVDEIIVIEAMYNTKHSIFSISILFRSPFCKELPSLLEAVSKLTLESEFYVAQQIVVLVHRRIGLRLSIALLSTSKIINIIHFLSLRYCLFTVSTLIES